MKETVNLVNMYDQCHFFFLSLFVLNLEISLKRHKLPSQTYMMAIIISLQWNGETCELQSL